MTTPSLPTVDVVIPVYNESNSIKSLIAALDAQTYPKDLVKIYFVDNNSADKTAEIIKESPHQYLLFDEAQNADLARNLAINKSNAMIIAFTDGDCLPSPTWLTNGIQALVNEKTDMVAGKISMTHG